MMSPLFLPTANHVCMFKPSDSHRFMPVLGVGFSFLRFVFFHFFATANTP